VADEQQHPQVAREAIREMHCQVGELLADEDGLALREIRKAVGLSKASGQLGILLRGDVILKRIEMSQETRASKGGVTLRQRPAGGSGPPASG
jgi:hypothetical protein